MFYLFKFTWIYADKDRWKLLVCYVLHAISLYGLLLQPYAFGMAINALQVYGITYLKPSILWLGLYLVGFVIFQIFYRWGKYFEISIGNRNQQRFINALYMKLCKLPIQWHVDHHSGVIVSRIKIASEALRDFGCNQSSYLKNAVLSVGPIFVLVGVNYSVTAVSLILIAVTLYIAFKLNRTIQGILVRETEDYHIFSGRLSDFIGNIRTVIALGLGIQTKVELNNKFESYYHQGMREISVNQVRTLIMDIGAIMIEFAAIILYIWSRRRSETAFLIGNLVMIITYLRQMRDAVFLVASSFYDTMSWKAALKSVNVIMDEASRDNTMQLKEAPLYWSSLFIKNLEFQYSRNQFRLLISELELTSNSKVAIVGTSGSGKSTFLYLLAGLYDPQRLEIYIDGSRYTDMSLFSNSTCLISQDIEIFENTIEYNITFGMESDEPELNRAIDCAGFREVVERLPNGIHTDIREKGVNLSGGEKQRLALARGLYFSKSKSMLLLDEITSSVDTVNERIIMKQILENYGGKCIICNIHKLHLLDMFDTILVMKDGQIIERGKLSELINSGGYFKVLWDEYQVNEKEH